MKKEKEGVGSSSITKFERDSEFGMHEQPNLVVNDTLLHYSESFVDRAENRAARVGPKITLCRPAWRLGADAFLEDLNACEKAPQAVARCVGSHEAQNFRQRLSLRFASVTV